MSVVATIAHRFLTGKKRNRFISFISGVSLFGVALGVTALIVVMSVMEGFETTLHRIITASHSHISLYTTGGLIQNEAALKKRLLANFSSDIEAVSPLVYSQVMIAYKGRVKGSAIMGVDRETGFKTTELEAQIIRGKFPGDAYVDKEGNQHLPEIILGSALAENLGVDVGNKIVVISPAAKEGELSTRSKRFLVSGISHTGMHDYDKKNSIVTIASARSFFDLGTKTISALRIKTKNAKNSILLAKRIKSSFGFPYQVRDWSELNRNLLYAVKIQKLVIFIVLISIIIVAAFNIMSTLVMMATEKKREMAILKAIGLVPKKAAQVYSILGLFIASAGALAGTAFGLLICYLLATTQLIKLKADVYFISVLPVEVRPLTLVFIILCAIFVALLATLYPAWSVARRSPVEGLRYE